VHEDEGAAVVVEVVAVVMMLDFTVRDTSRGV
jgi:hypothetical protein